jgi:hypothetical protein
MNRLDSEQGSVSIMVALLLPTLILCIALPVAFGLVAARAVWATAAADAAARAAGSYLYNEAQRRHLDRLEQWASCVPNAGPMTEWTGTACVWKGDELAGASGVSRLKCRLIDFWRARELGRAGDPELFFRTHFFLWPSDVEALKEAARTEARRVAEESVARSAPGAAVVEFKSSDPIGRADGGFEVVFDLEATRPAQLELPLLPPTVIQARTLVGTGNRVRVPGSILQGREPRGTELPVAVPDEPTRSDLLKYADAELCPGVFG